MTATEKQIREKALALTPSERLALAQDLWDSLSSAALPLSQEHARVIDERLASHAADPAAVVPWGLAREQIRKEIEKRQHEEQR